MVTVSSTPQLLPGRARPASSSGKTEVQSPAAPAHAGLPSMLAAVNAVEPAKQAQVSHRGTMTAARKESDVQRKAEETLQLSVRGRGRGRSLAAIRQRSDLPAAVSSAGVTDLLGGGAASALVEQKAWRNELSAARDRLVASLLPFASYEDELDVMARPAGFGGAGEEVAAREDEFADAVREATKALDHLIDYFLTGAAKRVQVLSSLDTTVSDQRDPPMDEMQIAEARHVREIIEGGPERSMIELREGLLEVAEKLRGAYRRNAGRLQEKVDASARLEAENLELRNQVEELEAHVARLHLDHEALQEELQAVEKSAIAMTSEALKAQEKIESQVAEINALRAEVATQKARADQIESNARASALKHEKEMAAALAVAENAKRRALENQVDANSSEIARLIELASAPERVACETVILELAEVEAKLEEERAERLSRASQADLDEQCAIAERESARAVQLQLRVNQLSAAIEDTRLEIKIMVAEKAALSEALAESDLSLHKAREQFSIVTSTKDAHTLAMRAAKDGATMTELRDRIVALEIQLRASETRAGEAHTRAAQLEEEVAQARAKILADAEARERERAQAHARALQAAAKAAAAEASGNAGIVLAASLYADRAALARRARRRLARMTYNKRLEREKEEAVAELIAAKAALDDMTIRAEELSFALERSRNALSKANRAADNAKRKATEADRLLKEATGSPSEDASIGTIDVGELLVANKLQANLLARREAEARHAEQLLAEANTELDTLSIANNALRRDLRRLDYALEVAANSESLIAAANVCADNWRSAAVAELRLSTVRSRTVEHDLEIVRFVAEIAKADATEAEASQRNLAKVRAAREKLKEIEVMALDEAARARSALVQENETMYVEGMDHRQDRSLQQSASLMPMSELSRSSRRSMEESEASATIALRYEMALRSERSRSRHAVRELISHLQEGFGAATSAAQFVRQSVAEKRLHAEIVTAAQRVRAAFSQLESPEGHFGPDRDMSALLKEVCSFVEVGVASIDAARREAVVKAAAAEAAFTRRAPTVSVGTAMTPRQHNKALRDTEGASAALHQVDTTVPATGPSAVSSIQNEARSDGEASRLDPPTLDELEGNAKAAHKLGGWLLEVRQRLGAEAARLDLAAVLTSRLGPHLGGSAGGINGANLAAELSATFDATARLLESLAAGQLLLRTSPAKASPRETKRPAQTSMPRQEPHSKFLADDASQEHSNITGDRNSPSPLGARPPQLDTQAIHAGYKRVGAGQLALSAVSAPRSVPFGQTHDVYLPRNAASEESAARNHPLRSAWPATSGQPLHSSTRAVTLRRLASPERRVDARPPRGEPLADTRDGRAAQKKAQWEARERELRTRRAEAAEAVMAQFGAVSYSGAIFAQLHSLLDSARAETTRPKTTSGLPPLRQMEESASAPTLPPRGNMNRDRPRSASSSSPRV